MIDLEKARKICDAATPEPWNIQKDKDAHYPSDIWAPKKSAWDEDDEEYNTICKFTTSCEYGYGSDIHVEKDAVFIAFARTALPEALDELEELRKYAASKRTYIENTTLYMEEIESLRKRCKEHEEIAYDAITEREELRRCLEYAEFRLASLDK